MIISKHLNKIILDNDIDQCLMDICNKMESYVIQDLIDYCDKVLFEIFKGKCSSLTICHVFAKTRITVLQCQNIMHNN